MADLQQIDGVYVNVIDQYTKESFTLAPTTDIDDDSSIDNVIYFKINNTYYKRPFSGAVNPKWFGVGYGDPTGWQAKFQQLLNTFNGVYTIIDLNVQIRLQTDLTVPDSFVLNVGPGCGIVTNGFTLTNFARVFSGRLDDAPTLNSTNLLTSDSVYRAINKLQTEVDQLFAAIITDPDVATFVANIATNLGTITTSQKIAVSKFVKAAKDHGYWDKYIEVYPFAGDNLAAALVKLKTGLNASSFISPTPSAVTYLPSGGITSVSEQVIDCALGPDPAERLIKGTSAYVDKATTCNTHFSNGDGLYLNPTFKLQIAPQSAFGFIGNCDNQFDTAHGTPGTGVYYARNTFDYVNYPFNPYYNTCKRGDSDYVMYVNGEQKVQNLTTDVLTHNRGGGLGIRLNSGSIFFATVNDGSFTEAQAAFEYTDVYQLMVDLGRELPSTFADNATTSINTQQLINIL